MGCEGKTGNNVDFLRRLSRTNRKQLQKEELDNM